MTNFERQKKIDLECLRVASELDQLAAKTTNSELRAIFLHRAKLWNEQAERGWRDEATDGLHLID